MSGLKRSGVLDAGAALIGLALVAGTAAQPAAEQHAPPPAVGYPIAVLQTLDKVTGRVRRVEAPIDRAQRFGTLEITVRTCRQRPPEETPETAAFLEVMEIKPSEAPRRLFTGWMFASSPALSALQHPVYDVWVIDCKSASPSSPGSR